MLLVDEIDGVNQRVSALRSFDGLGERYAAAVIVACVFVAKSRAQELATLADRKLDVVLSLSESGFSAPITSGKPEAGGGHRYGTLRTTG